MGNAFIHEKSNQPFSCYCSVWLCGGCTSIKPVTPNASPEAVALLKYIHSISGQHTLTGQHNYPTTKDASTLGAAEAWGKTPAIFGQDFGFAKPGDKDAVAARPEMIAEVKRQYEKGSIIALCWHAVPPTADEPVIFRSKPGAPAATKLDTVQGQLTDEQWNELITPGTKLNNHWCDQVDVIAGYLKQLQEAHIPVLWRPYHEMNGNWFWWGGRRGDARHHRALPPAVRPAGELSPPEQSGLDLERGPARHERKALR